MLNQIVPALLLLLMAFSLPGVTGARAIDADPADFLPSGARILSTARGDVDGDNREDLVALYSLRAVATAQPRASLLILLDAAGGVRPVHPFGAPPHDMTGEPALDPNGSANLTLADVNGDGVSEIQMRVTVQFQEPTPRTMLWVFGRGEAPARPDGDDTLPPPTWAGTGFRLEAFLEGTDVSVIAPGPASPHGAGMLRREGVEHGFSGSDPAVKVIETYRWHSDGFRLAERALSLPDSSADVARSPEAAVLAFYDAVARGDLQRATDLLGDDLRASRSATLASDPSATALMLRVEEVRTVDDLSSLRPRPDSERTVHVRVSMMDPGIDAPAFPSEAAPTAEPMTPTPRRTVAGTWRTQKVGDEWRLMAADLRVSADLTAIADALPPGVTLVQTASGDLRGRGVADVAAIVTGPGRFTMIEPYVIFATQIGLERAVPLSSFVPGGLLGGPGGTIRIDDINADGTPELSFSGFVGAHSALLWILRWDGSTLAPLFAEGSNSPAVGLDDLDGDGVPEIVLGQSGYCGSYAASPHMTFVFRWQDGAYRSASMQFPALHDGIDERAAQLANESPADGRNDTLACVQHMLAMASAFRDHPAETRAAYEAYAHLRQQVQADSRSFVRPVYLGAAYVEADLRAVLAAAASGQNPGWGPSELAILHDLLGDALRDRARNAQSEAEYAAGRGNTEAADHARRAASEALLAATREYEAALALDPTNEEARRALQE